VKPFIAIAAGTMGAAVLVAGCGSSSHASSGTSPGSSSTHSTSGAASSSSLAADYASTLKSGSCKVSFSEQGGSSGSVSGSGLISFASHEESFTVSAKGLTESMRLIGTTIYVQLPAAESKAFGGKTWASINLSGLGSKSPFAAELSGIGNSSSYLGFLKAVGAVHEVGSSTVNGQSATEFTATIKPADLAAKSGLPSAEVKAITKEVGASGSFPLHLWVDGSGQVVQEQFTPPSVAGTSPETLTIGFSDFGAPVNLTAPPASQTENLSKELAALGSSTSSSGT
jgi:hypothetical protein